MGRPRKDYRIQLDGYRDGEPFFDMLVDGKKHRLAAQDRKAAETEAAERYKTFTAAREEKRKAEAASGLQQPPLKPDNGTLRMAIALYLRSYTYGLYKPLTMKQHGSSLKIIMAMPASNGRHLLGESWLTDWLKPDASDAVGRIMAACGDRVWAAKHRRVALQKFFDWVLSKHPHAAEARAAFQLDARTARNPCNGIEDPEPMATKNGKRRGYTALTGEQVEELLHAYKDDAEKYRAIRFELMTGARVSDLRRLNRGMIKSTPNGRVLTYIPTKGDDSAFRDGRPDAAVVPLVPELEALIGEVPSDRFTFIHSKWDRPYLSDRSMSQTFRAWIREAGLPKGLSGHGMRKAATHWWLRNHRELIPNNFALKTIFGWATDKELERYTRDFNREAEADGMLIRLKRDRARVVVAD
jgi:integrase